MWVCTQVGEATNTVRETLGAGTDKASEGMQQTANRASEGASQAGNRAHEAYDQVSPLSLPYHLILRHFAPSPVLAVG